MALFVHNKCREAKRRAEGKCIRLKVFPLMPATYSYSTGHRDAKVAENSDCGSASSTHLATFVDLVRLDCDGRRS
jgi:hypothetical protein